MKFFSSILILTLVFPLVSAEPVPDEVLQKFKENVEHETKVEDEAEESEDEYIGSHRYDVPTIEEQKKMRKSKEKRHGRDDLN